MTVSLSSDKGSYTGTEVPKFTVTYSPEFAGKEVVLNAISFFGEYTVVDKATASSSGTTIFNYRPANQGNYTFQAMVSPCYIIFNCDYSNKLIISVTGDLPCPPLDPLCHIKGFDFTPILYIVILIMIYLYAKELGIFEKVRGIK